MYPLLVALALVLVGSPAFAHEAAVDLGTSPNGHYRVRVVERGKARQIAYEIVTARGGKVLCRIPSSYQPEDGGDWGWDWKQATGAEIQWSPTSRYVAIDEDVHRFIGDLFVVRVSRGRAVQMDLGREAIERAAHQPWDRVSIHQPEWTSARRLQVYLHGLLPAISPAWPTHKEFDVDLRIGSDERVFIEHVHAIGTSTP